MFPYAERAPKTYKKHYASTLKKDIFNYILPINFSIKQYVQEAANKLNKRQRIARHINRLQSTQPCTDSSDLD